MSTKTDQLEWRRSKIIEMRARGMTHQEIAHELQVSKASIGTDVQYLVSRLKELSKNTLQIIYQNNTRSVLPDTELHYSKW